MANSYHQIYMQAVFAVKYRAAVLYKTRRGKVQGVIGNLINETGCKTIIVNGVEDHMHCFIGLQPVVAVSELMKIVKAKSSNTSLTIALQKNGLNGNPVTGPFLIANGMLTRYISIFKTRKPVMQSKHSWMSILNY